MSERPDSRLQDGSSDTPAPDRSTAGSGATLTPDPRVEDYLDQVCAPLVELVPYARRVELRNELRGHLEALAASYHELETELGVAVEEALRQFGDPRELARRYADEWGRATPRSSPPLSPELFVALGCFALLMPANTLLWSLATLAGYEVGNWFRLASWSILTVTAGLTTGLIAPNRPVRIVLFALAVLSLSTLIPNVWLTDPAAGGGSVWLQVARKIGSHLFACAATNLVCVPLGCGGAILGRRLRDLLGMKHLVRLVR